MAERAKVSSVEALELFRAKLIVFLERAGGCLDDVNDTIRRTRIWLDDDQRMFWENQIRKRTRVLEQAEQELLSARNSTFKDSVQLEQMAVHKAKQSLEAAREKLRIVKAWARQYESRVEPLAKQNERLRAVIGYDMPKGVAFLGQAVKTLSDYAEIAVPGESAPASAPPQEDSASGDHEKQDPS